jgi:phage nucleotide-binding protein
MKFEPVKPVSQTMNFFQAPSKIDRGISIIIYGDPGKGKTTMATTLPEQETLIINTEAGLGPTLGTKHVIFNLKEELSQLDDLVKYLKTQEHPFKNIVVDNVSELEQWIILNITQSRNKEFTELKEYGDASSKLRAVLRTFRDMIYQGMNVVFNAWEAPLDLKNKDGELITKIFPKVSKKVAPEFCGIVDVVGRIEVYEKTGERWVRFGQHEQYLTKSQFKGLDDGEPANLPAIFKKLRDFDYTRSQDVLQSKEKGTPVVHSKKTPEPS